MIIVSERCIEEELKFPDSVHDVSVRCMKLDVHLLPPPQQPPFFALASLSVFAYFSLLRERVTAELPAGLNS